MAASFGVHMGATSMCLAVSRDGKTDVIANDAGDRTTPAIVAFTDHDQAVGLAAKQGLIRNAANTVCNNKHFLAKAPGDPSLDKFCQLGFAKVTEKNGNLVYQVQYKEKTAVFSPVHIATVLYKKMREIADSHGNGGESHNVVLCVPLDFTPEQISTLKEAATRAGFSVLRVVSEPCAAALAYDVGQTDPHETRNVIVYRLGGISMDVSLVNVSGGMYKVVKSETSLNYGGHKITDLLVNHFAGEFKRQWKQDCSDNKRSKAKLRSASEICKHILSTMQTAQCSVDSLYEGIDFQCTLSRARMEGICGAYIQSCISPVTRLIETAGMNKSQIHQVIVCGGSSRIPYLQQQLQDCCPDAEVMTSISPDEVLAVGAAKQAAILDGKDPSELDESEQDTEVPCLGADILVKMGGLESSKDRIVLAKGTPVPVRAKRTYHVLPDHNTACLQVGCLGADQEFVTLGKLCMNDLSETKELYANFNVRSDGSMHITCTDPSSDKMTEMSIGTS